MRFIFILSIFMNLSLFILSGCFSKQSGLYYKRGSPKCADHGEHQVCWTEQNIIWR